MQPNFKIQMYYQVNTKFTGVYGTCVVNLDGYRSIGTHWIALNANGKSVTYFENFGVEHSRRNQEIYWQQKYHNKYLQNTGL